MANAANHVVLSTGKVLFADPTLPWVPSNFPNLPSTALAITANGTIAGRNIDKLSFGNTIQYEVFENPPMRPNLIKSAVVDSQGNVTYADPKVSVVSTALTAYNIGINSFGSSNLGAPGITSYPPDTLTNAIGKLDGWITDLLLKQPPAVGVAQIEDSSLYAGVRWDNFRVYNILNASVPYVSGIVLMLGDPATNNYLTLELTNSDLFPDRQFTDGLASDFNPLVRLRIFSQFFPATGNQVYSKAYMSSQCVRIIGEAGIYTLPSTGKVYWLENSVQGETYTTLNLYCPNIPPGTNTPVRIIYINKTQSDVNICYTSSTTLTYGAPSAVSSIVQNLSSPTSFTLLVTPPIYSDATNYVSSCYFSSYNVQYTFKQYNTAHSSDLGFRYGLASPTPVTYPSYLVNYINSSFTQMYPVSGGFQDVLIKGTGGGLVLPGLQWSTSIYTTNSAHLIGSTLAGPNPAVSAFPYPTLSSISTASVNFSSDWAINSNQQNLSYISYDGGWKIDAQLSTSIVFVSSPQLTLFNVDRTVRFNDPSYPGCRSNVSYQSVFADLDNSKQRVSLTLTSSADNFPLDTPNVASVGSNFISTVLHESQNTVPYQKFYYSASIAGGQVISSISTQVQALCVIYENFTINDYNGPIQKQFMSTTHCYFATEPANDYSTTSVVFLSSITNIAQISGLYTPEIGSQFLFDIYGSNFVNNFARTIGLGQGQIFYNGAQVGPVTSYLSSVRVFKDLTEITTIPFPQNSSLHLSSCTATILSNIYQDPADPGNFTIRAKAVPTIPIESQAFVTEDLGPSLFIDTISEQLYSSFTDMNSSNGQRVLSLLPRYEVPGTVNNMNDGVNSIGQTSNGLNVQTSSFFIMSYTQPLFVSSSVVYNNTSSISSFYIDPYSRELLYTNGAYTHPGGLDFSIFDGTPLGKPNAIYPNFLTDLQNDVNYGNRYGCFLFNSISNAEPIAYQYVNVQLHNVSATGVIANNRTSNFYFPSDEMLNSCLQYCKTRIHLKFFSEVNNGVPMLYQSAWINCLKTVDYDFFSDSTYDVGGLVSVSVNGSNVTYKVQINRRFYTNIYTLIRVGISRDGSAEGLPPGSPDLPISFERVSVTITDV